jgi:hypothetical protein
MTHSNAHPLYLSTDDLDLPEDPEAPEEDEDELIYVTVLGVERYAGSVTLFKGVTDEAEITFVVDYNHACDREYALDHAEDDIEVAIESYQIWKATA